MKQGLSRKKLGILGGMGPLATAHFFRRIVENTQASRDQKHIDLVLFNEASMPDRTQAILTQNYEPFFLLLKGKAQSLAGLGVDHIALPCVTSHFFYNELQANVNVPIINMLQESIIYALEKYPEAKKIGILSTDGTLQSKMYHRYAERFGVSIIEPSTESQKKLVSIIYDEVKGGKKGNNKALARIISELKHNGAEMVILACTELSCLNYNLPTGCVDALEVLAKKSIEVSGGTYKGDL